jgi:hypothetical protein
MVTVIIGVHVFFLVRFLQIRLLFWPVGRRGARRGLGASIGQQS